LESIVAYTDVSNIGTIPIITIFLYLGFRIVYWFKWLMIISLCYAKVLMV